MAAITDTIAKIELTDCLWFAGETVGYGAVGYLAVGAITTANPIAGVIFGVTYVWGEHLVELCLDNGEFTWIAKFVLGLGLGFLAMVLCGFLIPLEICAALACVIMITKVALECLTCCFDLCQSCVNAVETVLDDPNLIQTLGQLLSGEAAEEMSRLSETPAEKPAEKSLLERWGPAREQMMSDK